MTEQGRVLVTGHLGYLGSHVAARLRAQGASVVGLDAGLYVPASGAGARPGPLKDVRDVERADLEGVRAIVHLAGLSSDPLAALVPDAARAINHRAGVRLAEMARSAGVERLIFASTLGVFGSAGDTWCDESTPVRPLTVYRETKASSETDLLALATDRFRPIIVRFPTLFGDSAALRLDLVLNLFVHRTLSGLPLEIDGNGVPWRPLLHVYDAARAIVAILALRRDVLGASVLNLCEEEHNHRVGDLARLIAEELPSAELRWKPEPPPAPGSYRVRSTEFRRWLGDFAPERPPRVAIRELAERLQRAPLTADEEAVGRRAAWIRSQLESGRLSADLRRV